MNKVRFLLLVMLFALSFSICCYADALNGGERAVDVSEEWKSASLINIDINECVAKDGRSLRLRMEENEDGEPLFFSLDKEQQEYLVSYANDGEYVLVWGFMARNSENPYVEIEPMSVKLTPPEIADARSPLFGKDYRMYCLEGDVLCEIAIDEFDSREINFTADKLGTYVLYYNPSVYSVVFYEEDIVSDDEGNIINEEYHRIDGLGRDETFDFPEIPEREGYVFTGWKQGQRMGSYVGEIYIDTKPTAFDATEIYASWCPEEEYTPIEVTLESEKITKGKEDGSEIILTLSEGRFDETLDNDIENDWKIVGNDELSIASVERIDDITAKIILSGNSENKYKKGEIQIEFNSELYISHEEFEQHEVHEIADIQLDENGIKKTMFISDNSITLEKQKRSSGNGGTSSYTVKFNTNGGEEIGSVRVERNAVAAEPETPVREGYVFEGWYTDAELTIPYDFEAKVTESFTLYAAWKEDESKRIILTVGDKKAVVFGKEVTNDVAPVIKNDRVMLPVRFVAESLGALVLWSVENPYEVKITKDDTELVIYIGEEEVWVQGEKVTLDSPAFLENDRTYLPIRFIAENLGCKVEWVQNTQEVIITK